MRQDERPRLSLRPQPLDWALDALALISLGLMFYLIGLHYGGLPDRVPTHFDARGQADGYGPKATLWLLPAIGLLLCGGLLCLARLPHLYNYPVPIRPDNAARQYRLAARLIRWLNAAVGLLFLYIAHSSIRVALGGQDALGLWFLPLVFGLTGLPIVVYLIKAAR